MNLPAVADKNRHSLIKSKSTGTTRTRRHRSSKHHSSKSSINPSGSSSSSSSHGGDGLLGSQLIKYCDLELSSQRSFSSLSRITEVSNTTDQSVNEFVREALSLFEKLEQEDEEEELLQQQQEAAAAAAARTHEVPCLVKPSSPPPSTVSGGGTPYAQPVKTKSPRNNRVLAGPNKTQGLNVVTPPSAAATPSASRHPRRQHRASQTRRSRSVPSCLDSSNMLEAQQQQQAVQQEQESPRQTSYYIPGITNRFAQPENDHTSASPTTKTATAAIPSRDDSHKARSDSARSRKSIQRRDDRTDVTKTEHANTTTTIHATQGGTKDRNSIRHPKSGSQVGVIASSNGKRRSLNDAIGAGGDTGSDDRTVTTSATSTTRQSRKGGRGRGGGGSNTGSISSNSNTYNYNSSSSSLSVRKRIWPDDPADVADDTVTTATSTTLSREGNSTNTNDMSAGASHAPSHHHPQNHSSANSTQMWEAAVDAKHNVVVVEDDDIGGDDTVTTVTTTTLSKEGNRTVQSQPTYMHGQRWTNAAAAAAAVGDGNGNGAATTVTTAATPSSAGNDRDDGTIIYHRKSKNKEKKNKGDRADKPPPLTVIEYLPFSERIVSSSRRQSSATSRRSRSIAALENEVMAAMSQLTRRDLCIEREPQQNRGMRSSSVPTLRLDRDAFDHEIPEPKKEKKSKKKKKKKKHKRPSKQNDGPCDPQGKKEEDKLTILPAQKDNPKKDWLADDGEWMSLMDALAAARRGSNNNGNNCSDSVSTSASGRGSFSSQSCATMCVIDRQEAIRKHLEGGVLGPSQLEPPGATPDDLGLGPRGRSSSSESNNSKCKEEKEKKSKKKKKKKSKKKEGETEERKRINNNSGDENNNNNNRARSRRRSKKQPESTIIAT